MLSSAPLAFVLSGAVHMHRGAMTALTEGCCLYSEGSGGTYCAHVGAVSNSGMLSCWRRTMASVPFLSRGAGDFCKNVSGMQRSVQSSSARCQCSVDANWRLSVWPLCRRCCYQLVLVPSLPWCCYIRCASIMVLVYRLRGGKSCLAGAREALVMVWLVCTSAWCKPRC